MHKQHPQTAYRKDAVLIGAILKIAIKKEAAAQYLCSSLLLAGIISIRRSICGRSGVPFLQGRLLLQQVYHAAQADASVLVAAEAISNCAEIPAFSTKSFITNSAIGLRQIFTWY